MESEYYKQNLLLALCEAKSRRGFCAPNPPVGTVVVKNGNVLATGRHWAAGHPHAEVDALNKLGDEARAATLFVTLEPCCHQGKTPPCTQLIIDRGIKTVIFAQLDPNPLVAGKGSQALQEVGIDCQHIETPEITEFYRSYLYWTQEKRPWVSLKLAISADEKIAGKDGTPMKITGEACREFTHTHRLHSDAILTTAETIIKDDPQMNVRTAHGNFSKPLYILDSQLRLPLHAKIFRTAKNISIYHREDVDVALKENLEQRGIRCVAIPASPEGLNLGDVLDDIARQGVHDLWVEAGARCFQSFYKANLAQRIYIYRSKKTLGENAMPAFFEDANPMSEKLSWQTLGEDEFCSLLSSPLRGECLGKVHR